MALRVNTRLIVVLALLGLALAAVAGRLAWLQVVERDTVLAKSYVDQETLEVMNRLLSKGVIKPSAEGRVVIDQDELERMVDRPAMRRRVRLVAARARLYPGQKTIDPRLLRVLAPGLRPGLRRVVRGRILDRWGRPLALTRFDQASGVQHREYPLGPAAGQAVGFHHPVFGTHGLEAALEPVLTRHDPTLLASANLPGLGLPSLGTDVRLTIDADLQKKAYQALAGRAGAAVILDVQTGNILAAVGSPAFDPNQRDHGAWRQARRADKGRALLAKPWERLYPPGSTFKLVVAAAWLEHNAEARLPEPVINHTGRDRWLRITDIKAYGRVGLDKAIYKSVNVYFSRLGVELGPKVPEMAVKLGFNQPWELLPLAQGLSMKTQPSLAYAAWRYPSRALAKGSQATRRMIRFTTYRRDPKIVAQCAIGQNMVAATPVQMAMVAQAIANDGVIMMPRLVSGIGNARAAGAYKPDAPMSAGRVMSKATAARLRYAMGKVMTHGTGRSAPKMTLADRPLAMAGKTGTAETGREKEKPHAWFIGFAPLANPRVAVAVVLEHGGLGSRQAAPLGAALLGEALGAKPEVKEQKKSEKGTT